MSDVLIPTSPVEENEAAAAGGPPLPDGGDPIALFEAWLREALKTEPNDANAMALATVDAAGMPDCRMVLDRKSTRLNSSHSS